MAGESWLVGVVLGTVVVLYQALSAALLFWCATLLPQFLLHSKPGTPSKEIEDGEITVQGERDKRNRSDKINDFCSPIARLFLWTIALALFIMWTDWYSLWIFGIKEGYPLMHPLIPLAQYPELLSLLPILGKPLLTLLFLLVPASCVALLWFKNGKALFIWALACMPWVLCWCRTMPEVQRPSWLAQIKTISFMAHSSANNPIAMMKIAGNEFKKLIAQHPKTTVIIMPESAFNCGVFWQFPDLLRLWHEQYLGKAVHLIFGSFRWHNNNYHNTAHWVYNGALQHCFDKRHAMLVSERLSWLIGLPVLQDVYFGQQAPTAISTNDRLSICISDNVTCVPYICSELFFNEYPDDIYENIPIIALVNDTPFMRSAASYIRDLLFLVARLKAIAWQRDIVYVSYTRSVFIDARGMVADINE